MSASTYEEYQSLESSEKAGLVILEAAKRLVGWESYNGSTYQIDFQYPVISSIAQASTALTLGTSADSLSASQYYFDRLNRKLYLRAASSVNPNSVYIACTFKLFFSNVAARLPYDLDDGFEVDWLPLLQSTSEFGLELDNQNQAGLALEGQGDVTFTNDHEFWGPIFDKLTFENQRCFVYSWNRDIPTTEASLVYRGRVLSKKWSISEITFELRDLINELRAELPLELTADISGAKLPPGQSRIVQRRIYGYVFGHRLQNIDQSINGTVRGYALTGTVSVTFSTTTLSGNGTAFLTELTPGDNILIDGVNATIATVTSNTAATFSSAWTGITQTGATIRLDTNDGRSFLNRVFCIAGHALREPVTTISSAEEATTQQFQITSATDFRPGDPVTIGTEEAEILRVSGTTIRLTGPLVGIPSNGTSVTRRAISNVYLDDKLLVVTRDYTYSATTAILTLTSTAEFNIAQPIQIPGTVTFDSNTTNSSVRTVSGSGTFFKKDVSPNDWISVGGGDYFKVLSVESDTSLTLRTVSTYTGAGTGTVKRPVYYKEGTSVLSCDVIGKTSTGASTGALIKTVPAIVEDLLVEAGLAVSSTSFDSASDVLPQRVGLVIPSQWNDRKIPTYREIIGRLNKSVFGAIVQNNEFEFEFVSIEPSLESSATTFREHDVLSFNIECDSEKIVSAVSCSYAQREYEPTSKDASNSSVDVTNDDAQYLAETTKTFNVESLLIDTDDATAYAYRWGHILSVARGLIQVKTKMQAASLNLWDLMDIEHEKFFERISGGSSHRRICAIQSVKRGIGGTSIELDDLSKAFSTVARICDDDAEDYDDASDDELIENGYITDTYGMMDNDPETFGKNLIW